MTGIVVNFLRRIKGVEKHAIIEKVKLIVFKASSGVVGLLVNSFTDIIGGPGVSWDAL